MDPVSEERKRIKRVYRARQPGDLYDPTRSDVRARAAARSGAWTRGLRGASHTLGTTLEVGCGTGDVLRWAQETGAHTAVGIDVLAERIDTASVTSSGALLARGDGQQLPVTTCSIDTVICSTLFSSVLDDAPAGRIASEIIRVLRPGGLILWFDFFRSNPRNEHVRRITSTDIARLFPGFESHLERVVLAPPLARRLEEFPRVAALLEAIRPLRTHYAGVLVRSSRSGSPTRNPAP
ncbi:MAG: class I SAM-dependent methyltransferase [Acidimicrobiia bacterium]|nr:class I SAM-dependent methyltransferase [Acidimicrobiia bacterium]